MQRFFFILLIIGIFAWLTYEKQSTRVEMKLVNQNTGFVLVEFNNLNTLIHDPFLKKEMESRGIIIPPFLRESFHGNRRVSLQDKDFQRAFKEVYYELHIDHETYQWKCDGS